MALLAHSQSLDSKLFLAERAFYQTSIGARQPLEGIGDLCREFGCLLLVDTVTSLGGKAIARQLLNEYNIEIGNGLGELAGQVWRVGLMSFNSRLENVDRLLEALRQVLHK